ncbi:MAG: Stp1/IreP family PP2C-type Ser/Thr phosphatase [Actinomycetota bacterium]
MRVEVGVVTDIGRVRDGNEDSYLVEPPLYAVADGMGGHRGGEVASQLALETVEELFLAGEGTLADQVREANRAVFTRSASDRSVTGMGTTLTAARIEGDGAHLVHVGDSRAYLLRAGSLRRLTEDHTLVNRMVKAGEISAAEADVHPHRNVLLRALGTDPDVEVDEQDLGLLAGDRLLLCSDGLTSMVTEDQVQAILEAEPQPQAAADRLVRAANRAGGIDNITVVVLDVLEGDDDPASSPAATASERQPPATGAPPNARGSTAEPARRVPWRWIVGAVVAIVILVAAFTGFRIWLDGRWYVGESNGNVAIFQGVPAQILGYELSSLEVETDLPADEVAALPDWDELPEGINANSREDALAIVARMQTVLAEQQQDQQGQANGQNQGAGSG